MNVVESMLNVPNSPVFESRPSVPAISPGSLVARPQGMRAPLDVFLRVYSRDTLLLGPFQPEGAMDRSHSPHFLGLLAGSTVRYHVLRLL